LWLFLYISIELATTKKTSLPEEELVSALKKRDTIAIRALYDSYSGALLGVIHRIVQHDEIAEDLLQETFLRVWNSADSYDPAKGRMFTWMMNIARNLAIDKLRSREFKNASKNRDIENNVAYVEAHNKVVFNPDTMGVREMINELKPEHFEVLNMIYFKGYTHVEAAEELNIPLGTLKTRGRLAIIELRKKFN
jgi:RNA polymerase sigma factor (sigma-70 family)